MIRSNNQQTMSCLLKQVRKSVIHAELRKADLQLKWQKEENGKSKGKIQKINNTSTCSEESI